MFIFARSEMSFCRKTTDIVTTVKGAKLLVLTGLRLCRKRVSKGCGCECAAYGLSEKPLSGSESEGDTWIRKVEVSAFRL